MTNPSETRDSELVKPWPLAGYAPGNYHCKCAICEALFEGDKRAVMCLECAARSVNTRLEAADTIDRLTSTGEAVAWRWRAKVNGEWGLWSVVDVDPNDWTWREHWEDLEVVPLYVSPREGHVEVPVEPTEAMLRAGRRVSTDGALAVYRAMLAALQSKKPE